jgi:toxin CcdB
MAQFDVHRNPNPASAKTSPFLLDVQSDLLNELSTRVVVPLAKLDLIGNKPVKFLNPVFVIEGEKYAMITPEMAGIPVKRLGPVHTSLSEMRAEIIRALDIVFLGV